MMFVCSRLTTGKIEKVDFHHVPAIRFLRVEAVGLKSSNYALKYTILVIYVKFQGENLIFC